MIVFFVIIYSIWLRRMVPERRKEGENSGTLCDRGTITCSLSWPEINHLDKIFNGKLKNINIANYISII
jgi:hypothetical protein